MRREFEAVLVHGDPALIPFAASFPAAPEIADRLIYTGYVWDTHLTLPVAGAPGPLPLPPEGRRGQQGAALPDHSLSAPGGGGDPHPNPPPQAGEGRVGVGGGEGRGEVGEVVPHGGVVVSAGGGAVGRALLEAALMARRQGCLADLPWLLLAGTNLPEAEFAALRRAAPPFVTIERFRRDFAGLLRGCRVSVSQAGYNTVLDILAARARAVLVPFAVERETEQLMRAERLAARGAAELVRECELTPSSLAGAIVRAAGREPTLLTIDTAGATRSARLITALVAGCPAAELAGKLGRDMIG